MREIKFRMYLPGINKLTYAHTISDLIAIYNSVSELKKDTVYEQYTGLKDDHGKEIYEGDIVSWTEVSKSPNCFGKITYRSPVVWEDGGFVVSSYQENDTYLGAYNDRCEIIGNIHENPELLKGGKVYEQV